MAKKIDWKNLGFSYMKTKGYLKCEYHKGKWGRIQMCTDPMVNLHIAATCLHYGQACFEGLKAFNHADGVTALFRPADNAKRMIASAERLIMVAPPEELFIKMCKRVVDLNSDYIPPYGTGASVYVRPVLVGSTPRIGVNPADDYVFIVLAIPVGPYYKNGFYPVNAFVQEGYDRAAPKGVGCIKAAGNYAAGLKGDLDGKHKGYPISLYLDSASHTFVDEFGTSNFFAITKDKRYVTPASSSILPSITNASLQQIAADFGMQVEKRPIPMSELADFSEVGACGTAAVITPVYSITFGDRVYTYGDEHKAGMILTKLFRQLQGIQYGEVPDTHRWMAPIK
jgi:branched-chain amino acid aminotransferase